MPTIRMRTTAAGPMGTFQEGKVYPNVPAALASDLVAAGAAEWAEPRRETAVAAPPEVRGAAVPPDSGDEEVSADLEALSRTELEEIAAAREIQVVRGDGRDLPPRKSDFVDALK